MEGGRAAAAMDEGALSSRARRFPCTTEIRRSVLLGGCTPDLDAERFLLLRQQTNRVSEEG